MRSFFALLFLGLLSVVGASSLQARNPLDSRALGDVCAYLDLELELDILGFDIPLGEIKVCLCISGVPGFCASNPIARKGVTVGGMAVTTSKLTSLIQQNAPKSKCSYPEYGTPQCVGTNPCGFSCPAGFIPYPTKNPTECHCPAPSVICNGVCQNKACPSGKPYHKREKRWTGSGECNARGAGHMACGVFGGAARAWECIDTDHDLESCGGCVLPLTPYTPVGVDCTAIPGVADVSCASGSCIVHRCSSGYSASTDSTHCVRDGEKHSEKLLEISASKYGLEHVPLSG